MKPTISLMAVLVATGLGCFAADVKTDGTWYNFKTKAGTDFGAGIGFAYNHSSSVPVYYNPGPPAWTFTAPSGGAKLTVLDGGEVGDVYNVWDNGVLVGVTSQPQQSIGACGGQPQECLDHPQSSKGVFTLAAGPHSITISILTTPYPDSFLSWFRVEANAGGPTELPVISQVVSAAGGPGAVQANIESGSWVTIFGQNLSATTTTWAGLINNGQLPTTVGGTSVTIDGQAAYVFYVSPTQINVQAPNIRTGTVDVVVRTSAGVSTPGKAEARTYAPAFFQWGASKYAVATRHPDYQLLGAPSLGSAWVSAKRGDIVVLWGTGFGPSRPAVQPGVLVSGTVDVDIPLITVGGIQLTVVGAAITPGLVGVYQVAVQIPSNMGTGDVELQASVGGVNTPTGVFLNIE